MRGLRHMKKIIDLSALDLSSMRLKSASMTLALALIVFSLAFLSGCGPVANLGEAPPQGDSVAQKIGSSYYLSTIEYTNGSLDRFEKNDYLFVIETAGTLTGHIRCNNFHANVIWDNTNVVTISNLTIESHSCPDDPLNIHEHTQMRYRFDRGLLTLESIPTNWTARFALTNLPSLISE